MSKKQVRLAFDSKYQPLADQVCEKLTLNSYSQLFTFLLKTYGSPLSDLVETKS